MSDGSDNSGRPGPDDLQTPFLFVPHGAPEPVEWMRKHPGWVKFPATFVPHAPAAVRMIPGTNRPWPLDKRGQPWPRSRFGQPLRPLDEYPPGVRAPGERYTGPIADPDEAVRGYMKLMAEGGGLGRFDPDAPIKAYWSARDVWENPWKYAGYPPPDTGRGGAPVRQVRDTSGAGRVAPIVPPGLTPPSPRPPVGAAGAAAAAALLDAIGDARERAAVVDALKRFGLDPTSAADVAAARAYVWAKNFGPLNFGVPWSGPETERMAEAVMRAEQAAPGTLARARRGDRDAFATLDRAIRAAKEPVPVRAPPGSGIETRNDEERALVDALVAQGKGAQDIQAALADLRSRRGGADRAVDQRHDGQPDEPPFPFHWPGTNNPPTGTSGSLSGSDKALREMEPQEHTIAQKLVSYGNNIKAIERSGEKTPDFYLNGVKTELKTLSSAASTDLSSSVRNTIREGRSQSGNILVDGTDQIGLTLEIARRGIGRAYGADPSGRISRVTILTPEGALTIPRDPGKP